MFDELSWLVDVISVTPAIRPNCRSSGVATAEAIVSGLAPGRFACTKMVGNSTCGSGATGSKRKAITPESARAAVSSEVATGRLMNGAERFTGYSACTGCAYLRRAALSARERVTRFASLSKKRYTTGGV